MRDSFLVNGVAFKTTFLYAGFEQQTILLNIEFDMKSKKESAEIRHANKI
jgi:T-complex protein 1 subunit eta